MTTQPYTIPDVSVIVITYNDAARLPRAVRSVLGQTLKNLEVIIVDDCSGDDTPAVAKALAEEDGRVRHIRLPANSGGCGAPRNAGMDAARSPFLMFLDSDDELPRHACKSLLLEAEATGADFVMGTVERVDEATGTVALWYPQLFAQRRIVDGIRAEPELLFNCLATNKLYRRTFLDVTGIRFPEDIHHEDIVWSTELFCRSKLFAVVPWPVYRWLLAATPATRSISSRRHELENVRQRVAAAVLSDRALVNTHSLDLKEDKDFRFLSHDLRLYLGDLPQRDPAWISDFADIVIPYVDTLEPAAIERLTRAERVCLQLVRERRGAEAALAAVELGGRHSVPPRAVTTDGDRVFWGTTPPRDEQARGELDVTELRLAEQPLSGALLRHELVDLQASRDQIRLRLRTYDPGRVLDGRTLTAWLRIGGRKRVIASIPVQMAPVVIESLEERESETPRGLEGQWEPEETERTRIPRMTGDPPEGTGILEGAVTISLPDLEWPDSAVRPQAVMISLHEGERGNLRPLLAVPGFSFTSVGTVGSGRLVLEASAHLPFRLMARRLGHAAERRFPSVPELWRGLLADLATPRNLGRFYRLVSMTVPVNRNLVLFESAEGTGYTGNPRYIHEELQRRATGLRAVWSHADTPERFPEDAGLVRRDTFRYAWTLARAGHWVDSHNLPYCYRKRKSTRYLQTWHGQVLKKMGLDEPRHRTQPALARKYAEAVARWDALLTPGPDFLRDFAEASGFRGELLHAGYPRTDVLVRHMEPAQRERARQVREFFEVPAGKRVILYAPTYRDNKRFSGDSIRIDLPALAGALSPDWVILVRAHQYDRFTVPDPLGWLVRDASAFPEVNDLMLASDVLVTDYSSIMFDYVCLGRPILYYVDDYERYASAQRGVCFDLAEVAPGPLLRDPDELAEALERLTEITERYRRRYTEFRDRWCGLDDGQASGRVVDAFFPEVMR